MATATIDIAAEFTGKKAFKQAETATDTDSDFAIIKFELNLIGVYKDLYNFIQEFNC
jgi:hypothetical protein